MILVIITSFLAGAVTILSLWAWSNRQDLLADAES